MNIFRALRGRGKWVVLLATALSLAFAATASAAYKPYSVVMTSNVGTTGASLTAVFTNETSPQSMGSANLTPPAGYTISSATVSQGTATVAHNTVQLRNMNLLASGPPLTVTINLSAAPCSTTNWTVEAKQSNDFSGPPGNDMNLDANTSNLSTSLCSAPCPKNKTCTAGLTEGPGSFNVLATSGKSTDTLQAAANTSSLDMLTCQLNGGTYSTDDPNTYQFLTTNTDRTKTVSLTFKAQAGHSLADEQICFDSPTKFTAVQTTTPTLTIGPAGASSDVPGWFMGILPDCPTSGPITSPCHDRSADTPGGSTITLVAIIPSGFSGDPHMG